MNAQGDIKKEVRLTIVIPVYEEHFRMQASLQQVQDFIAVTQDVAVDVIYVDDGSSDDSASMINAFLADRDDPALRMIHYPVNQGKGYAVKTGMMEAEGDLILMSDADFATPLSDWRKLKAALDEGADIACGSRAVPGAHYGRPPPRYRRLLSRIFNLLVRAAGVRGLRDTQCGFKLFRKAAAKRIFGVLRTKRFAFDVEVIALAHDMGYRVAEVPVNWDYSGYTTVRIFSSGGRMLLDVFLLAVRRTICGKHKG